MVSHMTRRSFLRAMAAGAGTLALAGCAPPIADEGKKRVVMVTDLAGIHDQGFNQLGWAGLQMLEQTGEYDVSYLESNYGSDFFTNLDKAIDYGADFVWSIGFSTADAAYLTARINTDLDVGFGIVDASTNGSPNLSGVLFAAEEPSFVVGYIAGRTTKSDKVGFVGGIASDNIYSFQYGYEAGVAYAAHEQEKNIAVDVQYAESFTDGAKGKSVAQRMFSDGCDVVYHAAGGVGVGVIEAAREAGKYAIGVDMDQSYLAPDAVLTSAIKRVDMAIADLTPKLISGEIQGGKDIMLHMHDGDYLGIPESHDLMGEDVYKAALGVMELIRSGELKVPATKEGFESFEGGLNS